MKFESRLIGLSREFVFSLIVVFLVGSGVFGGIYLVQKLVDQYKKNILTESEVNVLASKVNNLKAINTQEIQESAKIAVLALPDAPQALSVVNTIRTLAQENGIEVLNIRLNVSKKEKFGANLGSLDLLVELSGSPVSSKNFMGDIERTFPISYIKNGVFTNDKGLVKFNVVVQTFSKKLPSEIPSPTASLPEFSSDEEELLADILELSKSQTFALPPSVDSPIISDSGVPRPNPFSF